MENIDFKLDKIIEIFDLIKKMSWGAIPLWFSLTLPIIYIAYKKLLPAPGNQQAAEPQNFWQRVKAWVSLPQMDSIVIYSSLAMFVLGTITLYIDQNQRESIRNNGLRIKEYLLSENVYSISKDSLIKRVKNINVKNINHVLDDYPSEFIETENQFIVLMDSFHLTKIIETSEILLDSYMTGQKTETPVNIDDLFISPYFFTRRVVYKLITDSGFKYRFNLNNGVQQIVRK